MHVLRSRNYYFKDLLKNLFAHAKFLQSLLYAMKLI